jgi:hypothetical protein
MTEEQIDIDQKILLRQMIAKALESGILGKINIANGKVAYFMKIEK